LKIFSIIKFDDGITLNSKDRVPILVYMEVIKHPELVASSSTCNLHLFKDNVYFPLLKTPNVPSFDSLSSDIFHALPTKKNSVKDLTDSNQINSPLTEKLIDEKNSSSSKVITAQNDNTNINEMPPSLQDLFKKAPNATSTYDQKVKSESESWNEKKERFFDFIIYFLFIFIFIFYLFLFLFLFYYLFYYFLFYIFIFIYIFFIFNFVT
jgi:hypothetical protein